MIKTVSSDQGEILRNIMDLYHIQQFDADVTYGKGNFYKKTGIPEPRHKFDLHPQQPDVVEADVRLLPIPSLQWRYESIVFDPPFIHAPGKGSIMGQRFGGYPSQRLLREMYGEALIRIKHALKPKGLLIFKCQDCVESGKQNFNHCLIYNMALERGYTAEDLFILTRKSAIQGHNHADQQHARKTHAYFWIFRGPK